MRYFTFFIFLIFLSCRRPATTSTVSEFVECQELSFDISDGTMNGVKPNFPQNEIKEWIPCFSKLTPNGSEANCGGGIFYDKFHFSYYTYIDNCLEVYSGFKGRGDSILRKNRKEFAGYFGVPAKTTLSESNPDKDFFTTEYGCIRVHYKNDLPELIGIHYTDCESLNWCTK